MSREIYIDRGYSDPTGTEPYWSYPHDALCPRYGFKQFFTTFPSTLLAKKDEFGVWDMSGALAQFADIPQNSTVMIDLEGPAWKICDDHLGQPIPESIGMLREIIETCKVGRPDCTIGLYGIFPRNNGHKDYWATRNNAEDAFYKQVWNVAAKPIAEVADFIMPSFYVMSDMVLEQVLAWIRWTLGQCKLHYTDKRVLPILCPNFMDLCAKHASNKFTPEECEKINVPGEAWRPMLDTIAAAGINEIALWGENYYPWIETFPWVRELLDWKG